MEFGAEWNSNNQTVTAEPGGLFVWSLYSVSAVTLNLVLFALIIDIGGGIGLKYLALGAACLVGVIKLANSGVYIHWWIEAVLIGYITVSAIFSILAGVSLVYVYQDVSFIAFFVFLPLLKGLAASSIQRAFFRASFLGASTTILVFLFIYTNPESAPYFDKWGSEFRLGFLGIKPGFETLPNVYFRWSLWLLLGFSLVMYRRYLMASMIFALAVMITMSTALVLALVMMIIFLSVRGQSSYVKSIMAICIVLLAASFGWTLLLFSDADVLKFMLSKFSYESQSTATKLAHIESVIRVVTANWQVLMFGQGPGASFYSTGVGREVSNIETSYFQLLRIYGLIGVIVIFGYIVFVLVQLRHIGAAGFPWLLALLFMLLVAGTNPLLISPLFFVPLIMARMYALEFRRGIV